MSLRTPDAGLVNIQAFCDWREPYDYPENYEENFVKAMRENTLWHFDRNERYRKILESKNWTREKIEKLTAIDDLPFIPADFFKRFEIPTINKEDAFLHLTSSGTTGQKSQMFFDEWSIKSAQRMVDWIFEANDWVTSTPANYLLFTYQTESDSKLGTAYTDNFLCKFAPVNKVEVALKFSAKNKHDFDSFGCIMALHSFSLREFLDRE